MCGMQSKIKSQKAVIGVARSLRRRGKKIITVNGSFDLLHAGHVDFLESAKKAGGTLIVLLNSDASVSCYKGPGRPIHKEYDRAKVLAALSSVDYVVIFHELNPKALLSRMKPDVHCVGSDWGKDCVEAEAVRANGGRIKLIKLENGLSSSGVIQKIGNAKSIRAVFLDRDGTINHDKKGYMHKKEDFKLIPGAHEALKKLSASDYKIIIVTNQGGIGKGYYTLREMHALHDWMLKDFAKKGIRIDEVYFCPHHPDDNCGCRKPMPGMLLKAAKKFGLNLSQSWMIGDKESDIGAGREANTKTIKLPGPVSKQHKTKPDYYAKNLLEAVNIVLS